MMLDPKEQRERVESAIEAHAEQANFDELNAAVAHNERVWRTSYAGSFCDPDGKPVLMPEDWALVSLIRRQQSGLPIKIDPQTQRWFAAKKFEHPPDLPGTTVGEMNYGMTAKQPPTMADMAKAPGLAETIAEHRIGDDGKRSDGSVYQPAEEIGDTLSEDEFSRRVKRRLK